MPITNDEMLAAIKEVFADVGEFRTFLGAGKKQLQKRQLEAQLAAVDDPVKTAQAAAEVQRQQLQATLNAL